MDTSLALHPHHREWLHTQLVKRLSSPSSSSSSLFCNSWPAPPPFAQASTWPPLSPSPSPEVPSFSPDSSSWEEEGTTPSDLAWDDGDLPTTSSSPSSGSASSDSSSWGASSSPYRGPSSASSDPWMPGNQVLHGATSLSDAAVPSKTAAFADDVFMDPVADYISDMIVHGNMDHRQCMEQECLSFQATGNGISENEFSLRPSYITSNNVNEYPNSHSFGTDFMLEAEDYRWIENVLVADPLAESNSAGVAALTSDTVHTVDEEEQLTELPFLYRSSSLSCSNEALQSSFLNFSSSVNFSPNSGYGVLERGFNSSVAPSFPVSEHEYASPSLPVVPLGPEIMFDNTASFQDVSLVRRQTQAAEEQVAPLAFENMRTIKFAGELELKMPFPSIVKGTALFMNSFFVNQSPHAAGAAAQQVFSFVRNEYLKAEKHAKMYGDWWPDQTAIECIKKKRPTSSGKKNGKADPIDLRSLLVDCAQAVGANNIRKANEMVLELRQHASLNGTVAQRLAHHFTVALVARLAGTGAQQYTAMSANRPSAAETLRAQCLILEVCPYVKLAHFFANRNILKVAEGASRLHIVDFGIVYGLQWPALISALADRKGGPPQLRITGIEFPQPGLNPAERVQETGVRLAEYARTYNVPFEYQAIAKKWEDIELADFNLREGEVLAVNCVQRLRHLMDETVVTANMSPRRRVLSRIHSLNPDIVVIAILNAGYNAPFFVSRFREALYHYSSKFDIIECTVGDSENPQRNLLEHSCLSRDILNIVACEGHERVERPETYRQWQTRFQRAGFELLKLDQSFLKKARDVVKAFYHKDFSVDDDSKWMLLGWKGRIMEGLSAWRPKLSMI